MSPPVKLRVATYNVHRCKGMDGRVRPERIVDVLKEVDPDVIALQEVMFGEGDQDQARFIADGVGFHWVVGENRKLKGCAYGNVVVSRHPLRVIKNHDITVTGYERRGALHTDVILGPEDIIHVFNIHLGTAYLERRHQGRRLSERGNGILHDVGLTGAKIVLGDFNEWTTGLATQLLGSHLKSVDIRKHLKRRNTYPGVMPVMHLDHIYYDGPLELKKLTLHRSRKALVASDHVPLVADFEYLGMRTGERPHEAPGSEVVQEG